MNATAEAKPVKKLRASELVFDTEVYPRTMVNQSHVAQMAEAMRAGEQFPPLVVDKKTKRIVDGVNRWTAYQQVFGEDIEIECELVSPNTDGELFLLAVQLNTAHGLQLTPFERTKSLLRLEELGISRESAFHALRMTVEAGERMAQARTAYRALPGGHQQAVALKGSMTQFAGTVLTEKQERANKIVGGLRVHYYINQLVAFLEAGVLEHVGDEMFEKCVKLHALLGEELNEARHTRGKKAKAR